MSNKQIGLVIVSFIVLWLFPRESAAQQNCTQTLDEANNLYDQGRLVEVVRVLNAGTCLEVGFTREEKTRAYKLLALVYLFMDDEVNAEDAVINLLTVDPEHPLENTEPAEFVYMYNKYRSEPIFRVGLLAGGNLTSVNSIAEYGTFNTDSVNKIFSTGLGFQAGVAIEYEPVENLEIVLRAQYARQSYTVSYPITQDFLVEDLTENMSWLTVPLLVRYNFPMEKYTPYVTGGGAFQYLLGTTMTGDRDDRTVNNLSITDQRNSTNWSYVFGGGVKVDIRRTNSVFMEATYSMGGKNIVTNNGKRYADQNLDYNIGHIDNDKSVNSIQITFGWIKSIYNPKRYSDKVLEKKLNRQNKKRAHE